MVLTAFINLASFDISASIFAAFFLYGRVTFNPFAIGSLKNSFMNISKSVSLILYGKYSIFIFSFLANLE